MFLPFPNWSSSGWIQNQRNYIPTIDIVISVSVSPPSQIPPFPPLFCTHTDTNDYSIYSRYIVPLTLYPT